jgi:hypothetical protein
MVNLVHLIQSASSLPTDTSALERAISALESKITALESSSVPWEHRLPWFTGIVAFGVLMELWVLWDERREGIHAWGRGIICWPPDRPSFIRYIAEIVSVLLITGGIVAELWAGVKITQINGLLGSRGAELRSKSDQLVGLLNAKAEGLAKETEDERSARVKIEANVAWRHLTDKQKADIGAKLRPLTALETASVWFVSGDPESSMFADDIAESLRAANLVTAAPDGITWTRTPMDFNAPIKPSVTGVLVGSVDDPHSRSLSDAIIKELNSRGFDAKRGETTGSDTLAPTKLWVAVNPRPPGPQGEYKLQAQREVKAKKTSGSK